MTTTRTLGVGIIGASAERGWAKISHVPAVRALAGLELTAVASGTQVKGDAAARVFGAKAGYGDARDLINDPAVDIVTVAVKVPDHRELVLAALTAGKHVFCEWPLGRDLAETEELAAAAQKAGVHAVIGLQARLNPVVRQARELLAAGAVGRVLSARAYSSTMAFGPKVEAAMAFAEDAANGVTLVTIQGGHTLDLMVALLGPFTALSALTTTQFPQVEVANPRGARTQVRSIPDHLLVQARLAGGGALSVEVAGGRPADDTPFRLEVTGEDGSLVLEGGAPRGFQSGRLRLWLKGEAQPVDEGELAALPDVAVNVGGVYAALRDDIVQESWSTPGFDGALQLTRLVDRVLAPAADAMPRTAGQKME